MLLQEVMESPSSLTMHAVERIYIKLFTLERYYRVVCLPVAGKNVIKRSMIATWFGNIIAQF
jgi:hypothetical protein